MRNFGKHSLDIVATDIPSFEDALANKPIPGTVEQFIVVAVTEVHEFVHCVEILQRHAANGRRLIFRGHRKESWELVPSLMRHKLFSPGPTADEVDEYETELLSHFLDLARPFFPTPPRIDRQKWELLALAQHHKLPTRLLDWTYRAVTALFFAVGHSDDVASNGDAEDSCVWAIFSPQPLHSLNHMHDPEKINDVYLFNPPHISPRITMQQGCFTAHPSHYMVREYRWINSEPRVVFSLPRHVHSQIRTGLRALGINMAALFPDLDGICGFLREDVEPRRLPFHPH